VSDNKICVVFVIYFDKEMLNSWQEYYSQGGTGVMVHTLPPTISQTLQKGHITVE